jgi:hypothetical protein
VGHSITTILVTYLILLIAGGSLLSVVLSFSFNLTYLLVGYWYKQQEGQCTKISFLVCFFAKDWSLMLIAIVILTGLFEPALVTLHL